MCEHAEEYQPRKIEYCALILWLWVFAIISSACQWNSHIQQPGKKPMAFSKLPYREGGCKNNRYNTNEQLRFISRSLPEHRFYTLVFLLYLGSKGWQGHIEHNSADPQSCVSGGWSTAPRGEGAKEAIVHHLDKLMSAHFIKHLKARIALHLSLERCYDVLGGNILEADISSVASTSHWYTILANSHL